NNFMTRHFAEIRSIAHPALVNADLGEPDLRNQFRAPPPIEIENCDRFPGSIAQFFRRQQRSQMVAGWNVELARADKNAGAMFSRPVPVLVLDWTGRGNESDAPGANTADELGRVGRARDA